MFRFSSPHPALRASLSRSRAVQNVLAPLRGAWSLDICNSGKRLKRVPLPPGEGAAKRRVRAGMRNVFDQPALTRPFLDARPIGLALRAGHPLPELPEGEGLAPRQDPIMKTPTGLTFRVRHECGNEIQNPGRKVESAIAYTANPALPLGGSNVGSSVADFLLGVYFDNTYKVTSKLTLTLGLRYELVQPCKDDLGNEINVQIRQPLPYTTNVADPNLHPVLVRAGKGDFYDNVNFRFTNPDIQVARDGRL